MSRTKIFSRTGAVIAAAAIAAGLMVGGCFWGDDRADSGLIRGADEAWMAEYCRSAPGYCYGYVFKANGHVMSLDRNSGGGLTGEKRGTWSVKGDELMVKVNFSQTIPYSYSIHGSTLWLLRSDVWGEPEIFSRERGISWTKK